MWLRAVMPFLRWWYHHTHQLGASVTLELIALLDDKIAEANPGFTLTSVVALWQEAVDEGYEGQPWQVLLPMLAPIAEFGLQKFTKFKPHYHQVLNGGWESADLDRAYGRAQPWRDGTAAPPRAIGISRDDRIALNPASSGGAADQILPPVKTGTDS